MKRTKGQASPRRKQYARYLAHYTKQNSVILTLGALFVLGVVLGTLLVRSAGQQTIELLLRIIGDFAAKRQAQPFSESFVSGLTGPLQFVLVAFLCGFCSIAQPAEVFLPLFRGLGFGFSVSSLYAYYGVNSVGFVCLFMLPGMLLSTIALLFCCNEALRLSGSLWGLLHKRDIQVYSLKIYCARFVAASLLCVFAALLEAVVYTLLPGFFTLGPTLA